MRIIVLAGGSDQIPLIIELKKNNHYIILIDYYDNPIAKPYVDKHLVVSTLDDLAVKKIAIKENVKYIITACTDQALLTMAKVSEELNLPCYISHETALTVTNKTYMKKLMSENFIPTANYVITDEKSLITCACNLKFPLIVKPADCNSSKGVKKILDKSCFKDNVTSAISLSRTKSAIIEEYIIGDEISADFYVQNGKVKLLLATCSKKIPNSVLFTILQSTFPIVSKDEEKEIVKIAQKIVDVFKLDNSPLILQLIKNQTGFFVLEFSARIAGGSKSKIIELLTGVNIMRVFINMIFGIKTFIQPKYKYDHALMNYIYCYPGIIHNFLNFEILKENKTINEIFYYKTLNSKIIKSATSGDRAAGFLLLSNNKNDIIKRLKIVDNTIKIINSNGKDIMKHGLYTYR